MASLRLALGAAVFGHLLPGVPAPGPSGEGSYKCKDPKLGDWTVFGPAECGKNNDARCVDNQGDWTTWGMACFVTQTGGGGNPGRVRIVGPPPASHTEAPAPETPPPATPDNPSPAATAAPSDPAAPLPSRSANCDCGWSHGPWGCGTDDGTECWSHCCPRQPGCSCDWAALPGGGGCGRPDGTHCWDQCCAHTTAQCNCDWAKSGGCQRLSSRDGTPCWDHCCLAYGGPMRFWSNSVLRPNLSSGPSVVLIAVAAGAVLAAGTTLVAFAASRSSLRRQFAEWGLCSSYSRQLIREHDCDAVQPEPTAELVIADEDWEE